MSRGNRFNQSSSRVGFPVYVICERCGARLGQSVREMQGIDWPWDGRSLAQVADDGTTASLLVIVFQRVSYQAWWKPSFCVRCTSVLKRSLRRVAVRSSDLGPS